MPNFSCPNCQKVLKSSNPIAPGKKIRCPKCTKIFVMPESDEEAITATKPSAGPQARADGSRRERGPSQEAPSRS